MGVEEGDTLGMLIRHELALKRLYERFAAVLPTQKGFWQTLAAEEQQHAEWLAALRSASPTGLWLGANTHVKPQAIHTSLQYVESQVARAEEGAFSVRQALAMARDFERALLERQFSKLRDSAPPDMRAVLQRLAAATERHLRRVVEMISAECGRGQEARSPRPGGPRVCRRRRRTGHCTAVTHTSAVTTSHRHAPSPMPPFALGGEPSGTRTGPPRKVSASGLFSRLRLLRLLPPIASLTT